MADSTLPGYKGDPKGQGQTAGATRRSRNSLNTAGKVENLNGFPTPSGTAKKTGMPENTKGFPSKK